MIIQLPYINTRSHLSEMMRRYDDHAQLYNDEIKVKRQQSGDDIEEKKKHQTLKPTHRALFKDLVLEIGRVMLRNIRINEKLQQEQGNDGILKILSNPLVGEDFFICPTNRYQLSKHNKKEGSTIYRNLHRLIAAGIIKEKINHGQKSNFELLINAHFLVVSDKMNPTYNPLQKQAVGTLGEAFLSSPQFAKCTEDKKEREHLINKIYSGKPDKGQNSNPDVQGSQSAENSNFGALHPTSPDGENSTGGHKTGTLTGTKEVKLGVRSTEMGKRGFKPTGGAVDVVLMRDERGLTYQRLNKQENPDQWHAYHRLSFSAMFIDYLIEKIYDRRGVFIIPEARIKAIEYAEKYYFPSLKTTRESVKTIYKPCQSIEEYANRVNGLKWCIDAANRYASKKGAYFVMIDKYIDLEQNNGLVRTLEWYRNAKFNEKEKARHKKNRADLRKLNDLTREVMEKQTYEAYQMADKFVENHLNKYIWVFRRTMATILNENIIKPKK
jgi:hypothetical protein